MFIYTCEMCLKIIGKGFIFGKNAYLKDHFNILDFIIVVTSWLPTEVSSGSTL